MGILNYFFPKKSKEIIDEPKIDYSKIRNEAASILYDYYDTEFEKWYILDKCPLKVGDIVILDKYNILKGNNSWDGGAFIHRTLDMYPFDLEVTEVFGDKSLASEKVFKFLDWIMFDNFLNSKGDINKSALISHFKRYCYNHSNMFGMKTDNIFGFYFGIKYKVTNSDVNITIWGLNSNSFIKEGTPAYYTTYDLWKTETDLYYQTKKLNERKKELESQKENLYKMIQLEQKKYNNSK